MYLNILENYYLNISSVGHCFKESFLGFILREDNNFVTLIKL